jgi:hypothetical protein
MADRRWSLRDVVVPALAAALGFLVARLIPPPPDPGLATELARQRAALEALAAALTSTACGNGSGEMPAEARLARPAATAGLEPLRAEIVDLVGSTVRAEIASAKAKAEAELDPPPSPENLAAFDHATQVVDTAISSGHWSELQRTQMYAHVVALTGAQRLDLQRRIAAAINDGTLSFDVSGPPF